MNPGHRILPILLLMALTGARAPAFAQGSLTPPGAPEPTMKTLQQLWDKQLEMQAQLDRLQQQVAAQANLAWHITTVDSTGVVGLEASLAFGPDGHPAISYYAGTPSNDLKFARFNGAAWTSQTVDTIGDIASETSLAFGPDGQPAIAYYDFSPVNLKFADFNGTSWNIQTVDDGGLMGNSVSLAFGPDGQPAIAYFDDTNDDLRFARRGFFAPAP